MINFDFRGILYPQKSYVGNGVPVPYCLNDPCILGMRNIYESFSFTSNLDDAAVQTITLFLAIGYGSTAGDPVAYSADQSDISAITTLSYYRTGAAGTGAGCWTAFTETNYNGFSLALTSTNSTNIGTTPFQSIRLGCTANPERQI